MRRVRIEHDGSPAWGQLRDGEIVLDSGAALDPATVKWLAPVEPSKILAVHLTYRSRLVDYDARQPAEPSYFLKPPSSLNGHLGVDPAAARRALPQLRGRAGRGRRHAHARRRRAGRARLRLRLRAGQRRRPARLPARRSRIDAARQGTGRLPADRPRGRDEGRVVTRRRLRRSGRTSTARSSRAATRTTSSGTTATSWPISRG